MDEKMKIISSGTKETEWDNFKNNGGAITFTVDSKDICSNREFETSPSIQPDLQTGFELPPTSLINSPELQAKIMEQGSEWDNILCHVYLAGGNVIYKQISPGKYEATCNSSKIKE